jgi:hypothetical protein
VTTLITAPGIYPNLTPDQYHAEPCPAPALSNHVIGILTERTPKHAWAAHPQLGQRPDDRKATAATYRGSLVHRLALGKGSDFALSPYDEYRTNEAKAWRDSTIASGVIPVKEKDYVVAEAMAKIAEDAIEAAVEGEEYETEVVIAWQEETTFGPVWMRGMMDIWVPSLNRIVDLKTCISAADDKVDSLFSRYGYGRQSTFYPRGVEAILGCPGEVQFVDLFVETEYPHCTRTANSSEGMRAGCESEIERAIQTWGQCLYTDDWPGYEHRTVAPSTWKIREWTEAGIDAETD